MQPRSHWADLCVAMVMVYTYLIVEIGSVEGCTEEVTIGDGKDLLHVLQHLRCRGSRQSQDRHLGKLPLHDAKEFVVCIKP